MHFRRSCRMTRPCPCPRTRRMMSWTSYPPAWVSTGYSRRCSGAGHGRAARGRGVRLVGPRPMVGHCHLIGTGVCDRAGAPVPGGRPSAEPGGGRASGAAQRRRLDLSTAQFGNAGRARAMVERHAERLAERAPGRGRSRPGAMPGIDLPSWGASRLRAACPSRGMRAGMTSRQHG